ncbi:MAG: glycosyltransferase family 4 protein, partial [Synergistaceae bacterium]|nr:glycosyltransferase family 4 protein [Synergistaceae bacterium]
PVIGVNTGATPEIIIDGETGIICPLDDAAKLAELMLRFITNRELIYSMGQSAREHAVKNFSLERNTDTIYSLYQEFLH